MKLSDWMFRYSYFYVLEGKVIQDNQWIGNIVHVNGIATFPYEIGYPFQLKPLTDYLVKDADIQHPTFADTFDKRLIYFSFLGRKFMLFIKILYEIKKKLGFYKKDKE